MNYIAFDRPSSLFSFIKTITFNKPTLSINSVLKWPLETTNARSLCLEKRHS